MSEQLSRKFLFIDIETTGLDPERHEMLELGAVLTDDKFNELARFHTYIRTESALHEWDPWSVEQHIKSGLVLRSMKGLCASDAVIELGTWAEKAGCDKETQLAGSSIQFDLSFMREVVGDFEEGLKNFSHRRFDLSSFRTLDKLTGANLLPKQVDEMPHTALEDIAFDIEHAKKLLRIWEQFCPATCVTKPAASDAVVGSYPQSFGTAFHND